MNDRPPLVFIASSWKNREHVRSLANLCRKNGFDVYDFTDPSCRVCEEIPPEKCTETFDPDVHKYSDFINQPKFLAAVYENRQMLKVCSVVILILPCGIDATADWAYALGQGATSVIIGNPKKGEFSPTHAWANAIVETDEEAIKYLHQAYHLPG